MTDNDIDLDERTFERQLDEPEPDDDEARADDPCADDGFGDL